MTWLGTLNFVAIQWTGFRLARMSIGDVSLGWTWVGPVMPLTGWWSPYRFLWRRKP